MTTRPTRLAAAVLGCAALAAGAAGPAQASFKAPYNTKCAGSSISAVGSTFQNTLQSVWNANWGAASCGAVTAPVITYNAAGIPNGSGAGLAAMGATDAAGSPRALPTTFAFAGTDDAPTATQVANANEGPTVDAAADSDDAKLRTIPVAAGAIAIIVNYPDHCILPTGFTYTKTSGPAGNTRLALSRGRMERMFRAGTGNALWSDIVTGINDDNSVDADPNTNACANIPVKRVVRKDTSGSTLTIKRWLDVQRPATGWAALANLDWPNSTGNPNFIVPASTGGGALADAVNANDGSVGYVDLATARNKGFDLAPNTGDTTYWLPVQDQNSSYQDPQYFHYAQITNAAYQAFYGTPVKKGANCRATQFTNVPDVGANGKDADDTLGSWFDVNGVASGSNGGYPICLLTYDLAWDDNWDAFGGALPPTTPRPNEAAQRTVRDYLVYGTSLSGATKANENDYAQLPEDIRASIANPAAALISYNK
ncbi:MAG TPA: substrate-binding domain-containing protein [Baekduia sp.]|nr:substrate-binding domain-containing protein [Baekduia sp.]